MRKLIVAVAVGSIAVLSGISPATANTGSHPNVETQSASTAREPGAAVAARTDVWHGPYPNYIDCQLVQSQELFFLVKVTCEKHDDGGWWYMTH